MLKKHTFSPNHKVVEKSPHNFSMPGGSAGPAGIAGPAAGAGAPPGGGMDAGGGGAPAFADGGAPEGGGLKGTLDDYGTAIKQTASDIFSSKAKNPIASGNEAEPYEGTGGAAGNATRDKQIEDMSK